MLNPRSSASYPPGPDPYRPNCLHSTPETRENIPKTTPKSHTPIVDETTFEITHRATHIIPYKRLTTASLANSEDQTSYSRKGGCTNKSGTAINLIQNPNAGQNINSKRDLAATLILDAYHNPDQNPNADLNQNTGGSRNPARNSSRKRPKHRPE